LVLGLAFLVGGVKNGIQRFDAQLSGMHTAALAIAVVGLMMPALFHEAVPEAKFIETEGVSVGVAIILLLVYGAVIVFSFFTPDDGAPDAHPAHEPNWTMRASVGGLILAAALVAVASELLVHSLEEASKSLGLSELFIGLILVPVVGNAAEHFSAVIFAAKDRVNLAIEIAAGSGTQVALFVAPILVVISLIVGQPMDFFFSAFEIAAVGLSTIVLGFIALDGRSNWLEGVLLLASYLIMAVSFFFLPGGAA
jgi:Ca2+:H+ antiporter